MRSGCTEAGRPPTAASVRGDAHAGCLLTISIPIRMASVALSTDAIAVVTMTMQSGIVFTP